MGVTAVVNARCRLLQLGVYHLAGRYPAVDAAGTNHSACRRAGQRAASAGLGVGAPAVEQQAHLAFTRVSSVAELDQALAQAKGQPVMLNLYADWCVACKEFEKYTFSSPDVQQALKGTVLLQVDVTKNSPQDVALLKHLQVLGLPTILFFNAEGQEQPERRVTGFMDAAAFSAHLRDWQA